MKSIIKNVVTYDNAPVLQKVRIDGDYFLLTIPSTTKIDATWELLRHPFNWDMWKENWKKYGAETVISINDKSWILTSLNRRASVFTRHSETIEALEDKIEDGEKIHLMFVMVPMDSDGFEVDTDAMKDDPNFINCHGGTIYIDGNPTPPTEIPEKYNTFEIGDTVEGMALSWFKLGNVLYSAFAIPKTTSFAMMQKRFI